LKIYNLLGQLIFDRQKVDEGLQEFEYDASGVASGVYFYRLEATRMYESSRSITQGKKMIMVK